MPSDNSGLGEVVGELREASRASGGDRVCVGDLVDALDERGIGAALAILPLLELSPIGGIPGFPTLLAVSLGAITLRLLLGYEHLWVPSWIRRRSLSSSRVEKTLEWLTPVAARIDKRLEERVTRLVGPAGRRAACLVILCLLVIVPPLEVIPFATSAPMIVIAFFGLGLLFRDGLLMAIGFAGAVAATAFAGWLLVGPD